jgi:hypothetical protein
MRHLSRAAFRLALVLIPSSPARAAEENARKLPWINKVLRAPK